MSRHREWHAKRTRRRGQALVGIEQQLRQIVAQLAARGSPSDVRQAIMDVFEVYGQVGQMREVMVRLVDIIREHDSDSKREREELKGLLVQLRELARKQVRASEDLSRALGAGDGGWNGVERRRTG